MIKILVVDDDKFEREGLIYLLNKLFENLNTSYIEEYVIKDFRNGKLALEALEKENFDIVITDIKMPVMDGMELLEKASKSKPHITYIIYSGYNDFECAKQALHYNVAEFLVKPVNETEFNKILTRAIIDLKSNIKKDMKAELLSLKYGQSPENKSVFLHQLEGRLVFALSNSGNLDICNERLEKLNDYNVAVDAGEGEKLLWLCKNCAKKDNIENSLKYIFAGLDTVLIISRKVPDMEILEEEYMKIRKFKEGIALKEGFSILYARDYDNRKLFEKGNESILTELKTYIAQRDFLTMDMKESIIKNLKEEGEKFSLLIKNIGSAKYIFEIEESLNNLNSENELIVKVKDYISKNYSKDISVEDIAGHVFLNPGYLSTVFKKETGINIVNYITNYRINKAMELLKRNDFKIADIAKRVGYNNISYFNAIFRQKNGLTPNQYRKKEYENENRQQ